MSTIERLLDIFELFANRGRPLTLSQVADELDAPVSSVFGLVKVMTERGYLHTVGNRKEFYPTRRMLQNATAIAEHEPVIAQFNPMLEDLRDATGETVILGQMNSRSTGVVYLSVIEGNQTIRYSSPVGDTKPLYASAIGKVFLGIMPQDVMAAFVQKLKITQITGRTILSVDELLADIRAGAERGYQKTQGENVVDVGAVAMPFNAFGQTFAIAVAGPVDRISAREEAVVRSLKACIEKISRLG